MANFAAERVRAYSGMGRDRLLEELGALLEAQVKLERERDAYLSNLTATQGRCTELLVELRALRASFASAISMVGVYIANEDAIANGASYPVREIHEAHAHGAREALELISTGLEPEPERARTCLRYAAGGALVADDSLGGLAHEIADDEVAQFYGGRFTIAESMSLQTALSIAKAFGCELEVKS